MSIGCASLITKSLPQHDLHCLVAFPEEKPSSSGTSIIDPLLQLNGIPKNLCHGLSSLLCQFFKSLVGALVEVNIDAPHPRRAAGRRRAALWRSCFKHIRPFV